MKRFYSNGKILLTGEYVVLDGATALTLPTKYGQALEVQSLPTPIITWKSLDAHGNSWFATEFSIQNGEIELQDQKEFRNETDKNITERLLAILKEANHMNPLVLSQNTGFRIITKLDFPRDWGLGTSATLINNIADWFGIDAYNLLEKTFGGSGFDIAAAQHNGPVNFKMFPGRRTVLATSFNPKFKNELFFVYLNKKQNSRDSIKHYKKQTKANLSNTIEKITAITHKIATCDTILEFELLLEIHESIISKLLNIPKIKSQHFPDYSRALKSLGGWGGDFMLATGGIREREYFKDKGFTTLLEYDELVL